MSCFMYLHHILMNNTLLGVIVDDPVLGSPLTSIYATCHIGMCMPMVIVTTQNKHAQGWSDQRLVLLKNIAVILRNYKLASTWKVHKKPGDRIWNISVNCLYNTNNGNMMACIYYINILYAFRTDFILITIALSLNLSIKH